MSSLTLTVYWSIIYSARYLVEILFASLFYLLKTSFCVCFIILILLEQQQKCMYQNQSSH